MTKFKRESDFATPAEYQHYYQTVERPAIFGVQAGSLKSNYENQRQRYNESKLPTDKHGIERAKQTKLLSAYEESLRQEQRNPLGPNPRRLQSYADLIEQTKQSLSLIKETATFEASPAFKSITSKAEALRAIAPNDQESQALITFAYESFLEHKNQRQFEFETNLIIEKAEFAEKNRIADAEIASTYAKLQQSTKDIADSETKIANHQAIESAKGNVPNE